MELELFFSEDALLAGLDGKASETGLATGEKECITLSEADHKTWPSMHSHQNKNPNS